MPLIQVLDDALIDQIAAGEVVERPASVVKELLENALDAGASTIDIEIEGGGKELIRIVDNGCGMHADDAGICIRRHATSKIARLEDLDAIRTLGFRGEALPSIASVSRFVLTTRQAPAIEATRVRVVGGAEPEVREAGGPLGTTVEVKDLFFNVPARRKFLKADHTETAHIGSICQRIALAHPALRLRMLSASRLRREYLPARDRGERVRTILGDGTLQNVSAKRHGVTIEAYLSPPERARSGAQRLFLFVNGRSIRDARLARAVAFAYGSVLPPGRYPTGAIYLEVDPGEVDVNAHPQKTEVRFRQDRVVLDTITRAISDALGTTAWERPTHSASSSLRRAPDFWETRLGNPSAPTTDQSSKAAREAQLGAALFGQTPPEARPLSDAASALARSTQHGEAFAESRSSYDASDRGEPLKDTERHIEAQSLRSPDAADVMSHDAPLLRKPGPFGALRPLGQARNLFIVCEGEDGLYCVDQHAADERVRFHQLRQAYRSRGVQAQRLLFPERVVLSEDEAAAVETFGDELEGLGLEVRRIGETLAAVHTVPSLVARASAERLLRDALDELTLGGERRFGDAVDTVLATMACHGAIRGGDPLAPEECAALLRNLDAVDDYAGHCPHGRPVIFKVPFSEIERRLGR